MSGSSNFPTALDDDVSLGDVTDGVTPIIGAHHNNPKEALKSIEEKLGIYNTSVSTSIDYRLGHPSFSHSHDGASGGGRRINATSVVMSGYPTDGNSAHDHFSNATIHAPLSPNFILQQHLMGSVAVGSKLTAPVIMPRTLQCISIQAGLRHGPSGATTALISRVGGTNVYGASAGLGIAFAPGATAYRSVATPNVITWPSGAMVTLDSNAVGSSDPGQDAMLVFFFRE